MTIVDNSTSGLHLSIRSMIVHIWMTKISTSDLSEIDQDELFSIVRQTYRSVTMTISVIFVGSFDVTIAHT